MTVVGCSQAQGMTMVVKREDTCQTFKLTTPSIRFQQSYSHVILSLALNPISRYGVELRKHNFIIITFYTQRAPELAARFFLLIKNIMQVQNARGLGTYSLLQY